MHLHRGDPAVEPLADLRRVRLLELIAVRALVVHVHRDVRLARPVGLGRRGRVPTLGDRRSRDGFGRAGEEDAVAHHVLRVGYVGGCGDPVVDHEPDDSEDRDRSDPDRPLDPPLATLGALASLFAHHARVLAGLFATVTLRRSVRAPACCHPVSSHRRFSTRTNSMLGVRTFESAVAGPSMSSHDPDYVNSSVDSDNSVDQRGADATRAAWASRYARS